MARLRATTKENTRQVEARGKRTGVNILSQEIQVQKNGFEDPDAFFAEARSPVEKENPVRPKFTRFSIGSVQQQQQQYRDDDMSTSTGQTKRMMGRIKGLQSPSVLSPVSTAPASPENVARQQKRYESPERVRAESPPPPMNDYEDDLDDEDDLQQQPPVEEEDDDVEMPPPPPKPSQEDGTVAEQSIVEDDFMPPGPPDSPERDDESEIPTQTDDLRTQLSADEESLDEPNDGPGYSMPTTKTPQSAKMIRSHDRKKKNKSTKKDSKKRKKAQVVDTSSDDEMEEKPKKKTKPAKAKNKYTTTFSPKGIPLPLEYETIPVDELRQTQDVNENGKPCRRSKRARCAPLAFWKNEKIQYGVNEDVNVTSEIAKIPVPKAIIKAKETPYKPRTTRPRVVSASAKKKTKTSSEPTPVEDVAPVAFDSTRLRKKYQYRDEQEAELWDDTTEETQTTSKCEILVSGYIPKRSPISFHFAFLSLQRSLRTRVASNITNYPLAKIEQSLKAT